MAAKRILIVEDEPLIAMMLEDFLDVLGHVVAGVVDSVATALDLLGQGGIDAAILDVNLRGGETCWPIADALADADIPFILATGGGGESIVEAHRGRPILSKPFTMDNVDKAIEGLGS
jgi:DNA-binding response OmpR family regulator